MIKISDLETNDKISFALNPGAVHHSIACRTQKALGSYNDHWLSTQLHSDRGEGISSTGFNPAGNSR